MTIPEKIVAGGKQYTVTVIEEKAFFSCYALTKIKLPDTITAIKGYAFAYTDLKTIEIPKSVTEIVDTALNTCFYLKDISISEDNPKYSSDKQGCVYNKNKTELLFALYTVNNVVIPKTVKAIGKYAFSGTLLKSVKIPNSVERIKASAFDFCLNLKSINIPNSVKVIDGWAFSYCDALKKVTIGKNVTKIGKYAFENCSKLKTVAINSTKLKTIGTGAFYKDKKLTSIVLKTTKLTKKSVKANALKGTNKKLVIKVPTKMLSKYKKYFKNKGNTTVKVNAIIEN